VSLICVSPDAYNYDDDVFAASAGTVTTSILPLPNTANGSNNGAANASGGICSKRASSQQTFFSRQDLDLFSTKFKTLQQFMTSNMYLQTIFPDQFLCRLRRWRRRRWPRTRRPSPQRTQVEDGRSRVAQEEWKSDGCNRKRKRKQAS
jgi:hypothetical protein